MTPTAQEPGRYAPYDVGQNHRRPRRSYPCRHRDCDVAQCRLDAANSAQVARDPALILLSGILLLVAGIAIVRAHNVWSGGWPVLVTIVGWLALLGGLARMFFPIRLAAIAAQAGTSRALLIGSAVILLLLGGFLSYKAYSRE